MRLLTIAFQILQQNSKWAAVATLGMTLTGCNIFYNDSGSYGGGGGYSDPYKKAWYDVYGNRCTSYGYPMSGCNFYANGTKIIASEDPYYASKTLFYDYWTYTDSWGYRRGYNGYAWLSSTGILYDEYGNALNEMEDESQTTDVIEQASKKEADMARSVGKTFAQKFALQESAGVNIAKTLQDWAVISRDRARTDADVADISNRLYGVKFDQAKKAILDAAKGDASQVTELNIDVAAHWGTTPETSKAILKQWYKDEMASLGIK